ncbi:(Fe-S)-binding protein, partial [Wenyingzhuangia sp. 1_MG-2023]|nr:(Fe-S)-binding protein [Wenyingzhuangia sp. 1_MG-2023]
MINVLGLDNEILSIAQPPSADQPTRTVALHTSCSSRRGMGVAAQHMALATCLPGVTVVEPERVTECCGFGGTFAVKQADISAAMAEDKALAMDATG